jgi:tetratricopeptide (TPR) repeat protein
LANAYQDWANADAPPPDIQTRLSPALQKAIVLSRRRLGKGNDFQVLLALADLHIDTQDWIAGRSCLEQAAQLCNDSRLRRAEVDRRQGLLELRAERYTDAVESFRKAISVRTGDLELRSNLGKALLRAKRFADAREEYGRVLKCAPGTIDALIGLARVCIELADEGETEYYQQAEQRLSEALRHGRDASTGSTRLQGTSLEDALYQRGFARTKRWEAEGGAPLTLVRALRDFRDCKRNPQAHTAQTKIIAYLLQTTQESFLAWLGPLVMFCAATAVFVFVQLDFFFHGNGFVSSKNGTDGPITYGTLTFGALAFMIAALYLPNLSKFKVAGIELEKTVANQVSAPSSLGISRPRSSTS